VNPGTAAGASVGGLVGLAALALVAYVLYQRRAGGKHARKPLGAAAGAAAAPSVLVLNPIASGAPMHQNVYATQVVFNNYARVPEPQLAAAPAGEALPQGWTMFGPDEDGDVWYVDSAGNSHWSLPGASGV